MASPFDKYVRGKLLGAGSYGTATLFTTRDGKKVVIKEIDLSKLSPTDVKAAEGEVKVRGQSCNNVYRKYRVLRPSKPGLPGMRST